MKEKGKRGRGKEIEREKMKVGELKQVVGREGGRQRGRQKQRKTEKKGKG